MTEISSRPAVLPETQSETPRVGRSRIFLADDHPIVRQGLRALIDATEDLMVCGEASSGRETIEALSRSTPDLAVVDISLGDRNGVDLIKEITARFTLVHVLALSMYDESMYAMRVLRAGGRGYVMKHESPMALVTALRRVLAGGVYVSEKMATLLVDQMVLPSDRIRSHPTAQLTDRELEVLTLLGRGQSTREIAEDLFLSAKTIEAHRERIKEKLGLKNATELIRYALQYTMDRTKATKPSTPPT